MEWLPALLKHLAIARSAVLAAFVAAVVMLVGPRLASAYVPAPPTGWIPYLLAVSLFSGCLLVLWAIEAIWTAAKLPFAAAKALRGERVALDSKESAVIYALGCKPTEPINLDVLNYTTSSSRLELLEVVKGLSKKGLVETNPWSDQLVSLTEVGRKRAVQIHRSQHARE